MADTKTVRIVATNRIRHSGRVYTAGNEFEVDEKSAARLIEMSYAVKAGSKEAKAAIKEAEAAADEVEPEPPAPAPEHVAKVTVTACRIGLPFVVRRRNAGDLPAADNCGLPVVQPNRPRGLTAKALRDQVASCFGDDEVRGRIRGEERSQGRGIEVIGVAMG